MGQYANVSEAEEYSEPPVLSEGTYKLKISEVRDADKNGNELVDKNGDSYVWIVFRVDGYENKIWHMLYHNPDQNKSSYAPRAGALKRFLQAIECSTEGGNTDNWRDRVCRAVVGIEIYKDKERNKIQSFEPIENGAERKEAFKNDDDDLPF